MSTPQAVYFAQQSIELVNGERQRAGLRPLTEDAPLGRVAMDYSETMARRGFYGHKDPEGRDVSDRLRAIGYPALISAENIARGQPSPADVVAGWMASPGHRANILSPELRLIGAGYAFTDTPPYQHYWTHVFATPDVSVGRDTSGFPAEAIAALNRARAQFGVPALTPASDLAAIAAEQTTHLASAGADRFRQQAPVVMRAAANAAQTHYRQAVVLVAGGYNTPAEVVGFWLQGDGAPRLRDAGFRAAGVGYRFVANDKARHYWVAVIAG